MAKQILLIGHKINFQRNFYFFILVKWMVGTFGNDPVSHAKGGGSDHPGQTFV